MERVRNKEGATSVLLAQIVTCGRRGSVCLAELALVVDSSDTDG